MLFNLELRKLLNWLSCWKAAMAPAVQPTWFPPGKSRPREQGYHIARAGLGIDCWSCTSMHTHIHMHKHTNARAHTHMQKHTPPHTYTNIHLSTKVWNMATSSSFSFQIRHEQAHPRAP